MVHFVAGAFAALSLTSEAALSEAPNPSNPHATNLLPPESTQTLSEDWNTIAPYFEPVFSEMISQGIDVSSFGFSERFSDLSNRFAQYSRLFEVDASKSCVPAHEVWRLNMFPDLGEQLRTDGHLSSEQYTTSSLLSYHMSAPQGSTLQAIAVSAILSDLIICANSNPSIYNGTSGTYWPTIHIADYNTSSLLAHTQAGVEQSNENRLLTTSLFFNTITEEVTHAHQASSGVDFLPYSDRAVTRSDNKLWDLSWEAQANLITAIIFIEQDQYFVPSFLEAFITQESEVRTMIEILLPIFEEYGQETVRQNPHLLLPAYQSFFENDDMMNFYLSQRAGIYNQTDSFERLALDRYIEAFGQIPGFEGNIFVNSINGTLEVDDLNTVISWISTDTQTGQWFARANAALENGEDIPLLPLDVEAAQLQPPEFQ